MWLLYNFLTWFSPFYSLSSVDLLRQVLGPSGGQSNNIPESRNNIRMEQKIWFDISVRAELWNLKNGVSKSQLIPRLCWLRQMWLYIWSILVQWGVGGFWRQDIVTRVGHEFTRAGTARDRIRIFQIIKLVFQESWQRVPGDLDFEDLEMIFLMKLYWWFVCRDDIDDISDYI